MEAFRWEILSLYCSLIRSDSFGVGFSCILRTLAISLIPLEILGRGNWLQFCQKVFAVGKKLSRDLKTDVSASFGVTCIRREVEFELFSPKIGYLE